MESDIIRYYEQYDEEGRLTRRRWGQVEYLTTMKYLRKYLRPGDRVLDIGAGTGRYSITLASEGYDVTAVELVEHNLAILREKITENMIIQAVQGNALDLSCLESDSFDVTLMLGPMYHLKPGAEFRQAISEALRVTKPNGIVLVAYCTTDGPIINWVFRTGLYQILKQDGVIDDDTFCFHTSSKFVFEHVTKADVDKLMAEFPVQRLHYVATDGLTSFLQAEMEKMDQETFDALVRYHLSVCEREDLVGASAHSLDVFRKLS